MKSCWTGTGRTGAPRRSQKTAIANARRPGGHDAVAWWIAGLLAIGFAFTSTIAHGQTLQAPAASGPSTADYVRQSAMTDLFGITSSRVALEKSQNPEVRDFAQQMMSDHGRSTADLKQALKDGKVMMTVPTSLDPQREQDIKSLQEKPANQFDQAYLQGQIQGHRNALDVQRAYAQSGDNPALRQFASQATPLVQDHLAKLEVLAQRTFAARMCQAPATPAVSAHPEG